MTEPVLLALIGLVGAGGIGGVWVELVKTRRAVGSNGGSSLHDGVRRIVIQTAAHRLPVGVECVRLPATAEGIAPGEIVAALAGLGLRRILVEGGASTLSRFLAAGHLERLHVMIAPMIIGSGQIGIQLPVITALDAALRPQMTAFALPGGDILCDCAMAPPSPSGSGT